MKIERCDSNIKSCPPTFIKPLPSSIMLDFNVVIKEVDAFVDNHIKGNRATIAEYNRITTLIQEYFREYRRFLILSNALLKIRNRTLVLITNYLNTQA